MAERLEKGLMLALLALLFLEATSVLGEGEQEVEVQCPVKDYGAVGDGQTYDTEAIQKAINACAQSASMGTVLFETGKNYLTGSVTVASKVRLQLPEGASIVAGTQREDYGEDPESWYLFRFQNCRMCGLLGSGKIMGQASEWVEAESEDRKTIKDWEDGACTASFECRPRLIGIIDSDQVTVASVQILDPVYTAVHVLRSKAVAVVAVNIQGDTAIPNSGGIVVDGSSQVFIGACRINTAADAIAIKTTGSQAAGSILVDGCQLSSRSSAFIIGSETNAEISSVLVQNNIIVDSNRGLAIQLRDSANVHGITFANVTISTIHYGESWLGAAEPIYVTAVPRDSRTKLGYVFDVSIRNVSAECESGAVFMGNLASTLENIQLDDVHLLMRKRSMYPGGQRDLRPSSVLGVVSNNTRDSAFYIAYADHMLIRNSTVQWTTPIRNEWGQTVETEPRTVHSLSIQSLDSHDEAAHEEAAAETGPPRDAESLNRLRSFLKTSMSNIFRGGFLSTRDGPAQKAASSASVVLLLLIAIVFVGLMIGNYNDFEICKGCLPGRRPRKGVGFKPLEP